MSEIVEVDPRTLHLPPSKPTGANAEKLRGQMIRFGASAAGMPPPWAYRGSDGALVVYNGVTRATRLAMLAPGTPIRVEVVGVLRRPAGSLPTIGDLLP